MENKFLERIVIDPEIMAGKPVVRGTRVPVEHIIRAVAQGRTFEEILADWPHLAREDIQAALFYGADLVAGEEVFPLKVEGDT